MRRRLGLVALGVILGLLALEVALQIGAYALWRSAQGTSPSGAGAILCVGDSFTYGLGATAGGGSYPRQLETVLRVEGRERTVINGGWPGQTSREILLKLPAQLARHRPGVVCILAGMNDPWSRPERVRPDELSGAADAEAFPIQLRLARLATLIADWFRPRAGGEAPFLGAWHRGDTELVFEANGRLLVGKDELRWFEDETLGLQVVMPGGKVEVVRWERDGARLDLRGRAFSGSFEAGPAPPPSELVLGERALAARDLDAAVVHLRAALTEPATQARAREGLTRVAVLRDDRAERDAQLAALRTEFARSGDAETGAALVQACGAVGDVPAALATARVVLAKAPDSLRTWEVLLTHGLAKARDEVLALMDDVLVKASPEVAWRPTLLQMRANVRLPSDPDGALDDLFAAFLQDGNGAFLTRQLELAATALTPTKVAAALDRLAEAERARVRAAITGGGEDGVFSILRAHLEEAVALCRAAGAEVLLLSYPEPEPTRDRIVAAVAAGTGARHVDPQAAFAAALRTQDRAQIFILDGHCTDRGYAVLADEVKKALR